MGATTAAVYLGTLHAIAVIRFFFNILFNEGLPETGPAGTAVELGIGAEKGLAAADAIVLAGFMVIPVSPGKGPFCSSLPCYFKLLGSKLFAPFGIGFGYGVFFAALGRTGTDGGKN